MIEDLAIVAFRSVIMGFVERPPFDNIGSGEALENGNGGVVPFGLCNG